MLFKAEARLLIDNFVNENRYRIMKTKLVLWGTNAQEEKVLIALELRPKDNKVNIYTFPESVATEEFNKQMLNEWRNGQEVAFPESHTTMEKELSVTDGLLPDELKVERGDLIQRAQTEWHFVVLSSKLNEAYQSELAELKEKIEQLTAYDSQSWESLKSFWSKVQGQVRERNLFREHANHLRDNTNALFTKLKSLRASLDNEFQKLSETHYNTFMDTLKGMEERVDKGMHLSAIFDELKGLQRTFRDTKLTKEHRAKVWDRLDATFKAVKEKKFGPQANEDSSPMDRLKRRYNGLIVAIEKMEKSIKRDKDDLNFQNHKIATTDGQLEAQIRQAKIKMIEERIRSKEEKLTEMHKTREDLEKRIDQQKGKDAKRAEQEKVNAAKAAAKEKIAAEIKEAEAARKGDEKIEKAAEAISKGKEEPKTEDTMASAVATTMDEATDSMKEAIEDVVDTIRAVAEVVGGKVTEAVEEVKEKVETIVEEMKEEPKEETKEGDEAKGGDTLEQSDDLKAIEGIGPKIAEHLNNAGITTYAGLAGASVDKLKEILSAAGPRYKSHNPTTWPRQAQMAADGKWDELKVWQDELDGGKEVAKGSGEEE